VKRELTSPSQTKTNNKVSVAYLGFGLAKGVTPDCFGPNVSNITTEACVSVGDARERRGYGVAVGGALTLNHPEHRRVATLEVRNSP
jgi:hypothetical protein